MAAQRSIETSLFPQPTIAPILCAKWTTGTQQLASVEISTLRVAQGGLIGGDTGDKVYMCLSPGPSASLQIGPKCKRLLQNRFGKRLSWKRLFRHT